MNISIIGTGYVGLVSGLCLAEMGHRVTCVDHDPAKLATINAGTPPIFEKGLSELLTKHLGDRFRATGELASAVRESQVTLIAVGTPYRGDQIDLAYVVEAARQIGRALRSKKEPHCVVVKSTVVPGTTDDVVGPELVRESGKAIGPALGLCMNPEFLREGEAVGDFLFPDRIVIGGADEGSRQVLREVYAPFKGVPLVETNNRTAEMIKYASNSLLATLISFSNEIANTCGAQPGVDVVDVLKAVCLDQRLSPKLPSGERVRPGVLTYLEAGCGFGGSCFPKDVRALIAHGKRHGNPMGILEAVIAVNEAQPPRLLQLLTKHFPEWKNVRVSVLGIAFKPGTDDVRESPAIPIVQALLARGARVTVYDPVAAEAARTIFGDSVEYASRLESAIDEADAIVLVTRWEEFEHVPTLLTRKERQPLVIDGRRILDRETVRRYEGVGLGS